MADTALHVARNEDELREQKEQLERQIKDLSNALTQPTSAKKKKRPTPSLISPMLPPHVAASPRLAASEVENTEPRPTPSKSTVSSLITPSKLFSNKRRTLTASQGRLLTQSAAFRGAATESSWQSTVSEVDLTSLSTMERTRQEAIHDLVRSEATFVTILDALMQHYYRPIQTGKMFSTKEFDSIFANLADLVEIHHDFAQALENRQKDEFPMIDVIADVITKFTEQSKAYVKYSANQHRMELEINRQFHSNKAFISFVNTLNQQKQTMPSGMILNIREDLIKPVVRLNRYSSIFKTICDHTREDHKDYALLRAAVVAMEKLLNNIVEEKKINDNLDRIQELQFSIDFSVCPKPVILARTPDTRIVREGRVTLLDIGKEMRTRSKKLIHLFVIGDMLYITSDNTESKDKKVLKLLTPPAPLLSVTNVDIQDFDFERSNLLEIRISEPSQLFVLQCSSLDEKKSWMAVLGNTLHLSNDTQSLSKPTTMLMERISSFERQSFSSETEEPNYVVISSKIQRRPSQNYVKERRDLFEGLKDLVRKEKDDVPTEPVDTRLTDKQLGLADGERNVARTTALITVSITVDGQPSWVKWGKGEVLIAYKESRGVTRLIAYPDDDKLRQAKTAINATLHTSMRNEKIEDKKLRIVVNTLGGSPLQFLLQLKNKEARDLIWDTIEKYKMLHGEGNEAAVMKTSTSQEINATSSPVPPPTTTAATTVSKPQLYPSRPSTTTTTTATTPKTSVQKKPVAGESDEESSNSEEEEEEEEKEEEEEEKEDEEEPLKDNKSSLRHEISSDSEQEEEEKVASQAEEIKALRAALVEQQAVVAKLYQQREYEQKIVQRLMAKHAAIVEKLQAEKAELEKQLEQR